VREQLVLAALVAVGVSEADGEADGEGEGTVRRHCMPLTKCCPVHNVETNSVLLSSS
jgi:hypothetical protein